MKGILMSAPMVRAILDGRKTQTRRVATRHIQALGSPEEWCGRIGTPEFERIVGDYSRYAPFKPGETVYVKETWRVDDWGEDGVCVRFEADGGRLIDVYPDDDEGHERLWIQGTDDLIAAGYRDDGDGDFGDWRDAEGRPITPEAHISAMRKRPSIYMPEWASRMKLRITDVRAERLQEITEADARAEGITDGGCLNCGMPEPCGCNNPRPDARDAYIHLWETLNEKKPGRTWVHNPWVWVITFEVIA